MTPNQECLLKEMQERQQRWDRDGAWWVSSGLYFPLGHLDSWSDLPKQSLFMNTSFLLNSEKRVMFTQVWGT